MQKYDATPEIKKWQKRLLPRATWRPYQYNGFETLWYAHERDYRAYLTPCCSSTMDVAWSLADYGHFPEMSWVIAMAQTQGRGQFGRIWISAEGNLFVTLRLPYQAVEAGPLLSLAVAVILTDELKEHGLASEIKWPNDILVGGKKAGGILIEQRQGKVMAGIGLNANHAPVCQNNSAEFKVPACGLNAFGLRVGTPELWRSLSQRFRSTLAQILEAPDALQNKVAQVFAYKGEGIILEKSNGQSALVQVSGVDSLGGLVVMTPKGEAIIRSGRLVPRTTV